jgi:hypothetical protein
MPFNLSIYQLSHLPIDPALPRYPSIRIPKGLSAAIPDRSQGPPLPPYPPTRIPKGLAHSIPRYPRAFRGIMASIRIPKDLHWRIPDCLLVPQPALSDPEFAKGESNGYLRWLWVLLPGSAYDKSLFVCCQDVLKYRGCKARKSAEAHPSAALCHRCRHSVILTEPRARHE